MGAEESRMYPGQEGSYASRQAPPAATRTNYSQASQNPVQRIAPTILPQPVLLVGYTPDGAPILMSNTAQNNVSTLTTQPSQAYATNANQHAPTNPMLTASPTATTTPSYAATTSNELMTNLFAMQTPVMAVPTTILGPDGQSYTALVKPNTQQEIGAQIIEQGLLSTGGTYQLVREPTGRIVRHVFHDKPMTATNTATGTSRASQTSKPSYANTSTATSPYSRSSSSSSPHSTKTQLPQPAYARQAHSATNTASTTSTNGDSSGSQKLRTSYTSTTKPAPSPPHPTVQSTADFLRQNSSLDTSYGSSPSSRDSPSEPRLLNYVTWDSDIAKVPTKDVKEQTSEAPKIAAAAKPKEPSPSIYPDLDSTASTKPQTQEISASHTPSKALKYHLTHGGDKGLVDVENPYEDL